MSDTLDNILDVDTFNAQFKAGKFDHLLINKKKKEVKAKRKTASPAIAYTRPTAILPYVTRISCKTCNSLSLYITGWGVQTPKKTGFAVSTVNIHNTKEFNELFKTEKFAEPYITELLMLQCEKCCTPSTLLKDC